MAIVEKVINILNKNSAQDLFQNTVIDGVELNKPQVPRRRI